MTTPEHVASDEKPWVSRMRLIVRPLVAATVGVAAGTAWAILLAIVTGSVNELAYHLVCFPLGLGITAIIVFYLRHCPEDKMDETTRPRWYRLTPGRLVIGLLLVECLLWLSERFQWFAFNQHKGWTVLFGVVGVGLAVLLMLLWFIIALLSRLRFQFSIRSLFVLTVAVAVPFSWLAVEMKAAREQKDAVEEIEKLGGQVGSSQPSERASLRGLLGDDLFRQVDLVTLIATPVTDADLEHLKGLSQLQWLNLGSTQVTDAGLAHIAGLTQLRELYLQSTQITDAGLAQLAGLTQLRVLYLNDTHIGDAGLAHLAGLTRLEDLTLNNTQITDAGLAYFAGLSQLQYLHLNNTQIRDAGLAHVARLPRLRLLSLDGTQLTDAGLVEIAGLWRLNILGLRNTQITDAGLAHLVGLTQVQVLWLKNNPQITDSGVKKLKQALPNCRFEN